MQTLFCPNRRNRAFKKRLYILLALTALLFFMLVLRLTYLQWLHFPYYHHLSEKNYLSFVVKAPKRGLILDRKGHILADNQPMLSLEVKPEYLMNIASVITKLKTIFPDIRLPKHWPRHSLKPFPIRLNLTPEEVATFYVHRHQLPELIIQGHLHRDYPYGALTESALGKTGRLRPEDLKALDKKNYMGSIFIGKQGLESFYETILHGDSGLTHVAVDAHGTSVEQTLSQQPKAGKNLIISLDLALQKKAYQAFQGEQGALVAINPQNGEILAFLSHPNTDPNALITNIDPHHYQQLIQDPKKPLFNRALSGLYPPGSTIKPLLALAALEHHLITPQDTVIDHGYYQIPHLKHKFRCWKHDGHGKINVVQAIIVSCDTFFYWLADQLMGISMINQAFRAFGLGQSPDVDIVPRKQGVLNSPEWKKNHQHARWYPGDTVISTIGQGNMLVTPLQMAHVANQLAMRGHGYLPHFAIAIQDGDHIDPLKPVHAPSITYSPKTWKSVIGAMGQVTLKGTGWRFGQSHYSVASKTGTAQLFHAEHYQESKLPKKLWDHAWYIGFAPIDHPKIALAVITEHSHQAIIIARKVMDAYLLRPKT